MRSCIVAIPTKDEAERLPACLNALAGQRDPTGRPLARGAFGVVIFANNCRDASAEVAHSMAPGMPFPTRVVEASLLPRFAHAGGARRAAMDLAETWLLARGEPRGVILTTDADSRVAPDWIVNNLAAIEAGADAVLGRVVLDEDGDLLPQALHDRGALESAYEDLLTEIAALLDPVDDNPWPHHATISGATIAVTREAYRRVGGLPCVPLGEDKAFVAKLSRIDAEDSILPSHRGDHLGPDDRPRPRRGRRHVASAQRNARRRLRRCAGASARRGPAGDVAGPNAATLSLLPSRLRPALERRSRR